ncbi:hypothetical protein BU16DRAFT_531432 [Lophium mytilinum]|uniref:F-box domain-containing protein n=1 Tax=Lophium mytilinum TaxID=390894 RepID=A0A6A6QF39_9PEZI|nr:hypothetical protein BU16DRAFT_531432 [Lophium mytilinum]
MGALPTELLLHIFSCLDIPPPSVLKFSQTPTKDLPSATSSPLKALSLTCRQFHTLVTPLLFRHVVLRLDDTPTWLPVDEDTLNAMQPVFKTLSAHERDIYTRMRKNIAKSFQRVIEGREIGEMEEFIWIRDDDHWFAQSSAAVGVPQLPSCFEDFQAFLSKERGPGYPPLIDKVESLVIVASKKYDHTHKTFRNAEAALHQAVTDLWARVFDVLDPVRVVVVAPPTTMLELAELTVPSNGAVWEFEQDFHYLELRQDRAPNHGRRGKTQRVPLEHDPECARAWHDYRALVHARPWTHIAYNEGSWLPLYIPGNRANSVTHWWQWDVPNILYLLLDRLNREARVCCSLRSVAFITVFPTSETISVMLQPLREHPTLELLTMQLSAEPSNDVVDEKEIFGLDEPPEDFLRRWRICCGYVAVFLFHRQWNKPGEFWMMDKAGAVELRRRIAEAGEELHGAMGWKEVADGRWKRV